MIEVVVHIVGKVFKLGKVTRELHADFANWTVTLLTNNDLCNTQIFGMFVVDLVTINEQYDVCVLLNGTGFT